MGTGVVAVEQQTAGAVVWTACTPSLKDSGQVNVNVQVGGDRLPLLERVRGHVTGSGTEDRDDLFGSAPRCFEFPRWALAREQPYWRLLLGFPVLLVYTNPVISNDVPDLLCLASVIFSKPVNAALHPTPLLFLGQLVEHPTGATPPSTPLFMKIRLKLAGDSNSL